MASTTLAPTASTCALSGRTTRRSCPFTSQSTWPRSVARRRPLPTWSLCSRGLASSRRRHHQPAPSCCSAWSSSTTTGSTLSCVPLWRRSLSATISSLARRIRTQQQPLPPRLQTPQRQPPLPLPLLLLLLLPLPLPLPLQPKSDITKVHLRGVYVRYFVYGYGLRLCYKTSTLSKFHSSLCPLSVGRRPTPFFSVL
jgi:hypothetical protein